MRKAEHCEIKKIEPSFTKVHSVASAVTAAARKHHVICCHILSLAMAAGDTACVFHLIFCTEL